MKFKNGLVQRESGDPSIAVDLLATNRREGNGSFKPRYVVIHYTVSRTAASSLAWFKNPAAKASAHFLIDRDGSIIQCVSCEDVAFHAGRSSWAGIDGLNQHSIGIELVNAGVLRRNSDGAWLDAYGRAVPSAEVLVLPHKIDGIERGWQTYTDVQLESAEQLTALLMTTYPMKEVLGHDDISPRRKLDPGPAFPMDAFRARVAGREDEQAKRYRTNSALNLRQGPSTAHAIITTLASGAIVEQIQQSGSWFYVELVDRPDIEGWVNSRFLSIV